MLLFGRGGGVVEEDVGIKRGGGRGGGGGGLVCSVFGFWFWFFKPHK